MHKRKRSTVPVEFVRDTANRYLALALNTPDERDTPAMVGFRRGVMALLEAVLFETGTYAGFAYLGARYADTMPDIPADDDTLRYYYGGVGR